MEKPGLGREGVGGKILFHLFPAPGDNSKTIIWMSYCLEFVCFGLGFFSFMKRNTYFSNFNCSFLLPVPAHYFASGQSLGKS